jgi:hypothetical protein
MRRDRGGEGSLRQVEAGSRNSRDLRQLKTITQLLSGCEVRISA